jgi:UDP-2,3-diacylglucosamine pyrophosphatase LpxH
MKPISLCLTVLLGVACASVESRAQPIMDQRDVAAAVVPFTPTAAQPRYRAFVSDLHLGIGRKPDGHWQATEDFRWPRALDGFLNEISLKGNGKTDLVIVGDFLEMWQPPSLIRCAGVSADLGCTLDEMAQLSAIIAEQHQVALDALRSFAEREDNRLHIVPGNHDSTLRYERVWAPIGRRLNSSSGRINLVLDGVWASPDGKIVAEHGHQIGLDVNRYDTWPRVVQNHKGVDYVMRPWGELFVQKLFNEQEETYPIIDNLSPESAGARYRAADRGTWGSAADIGRFLLFNLLETSSKQQAAMLGASPDGKVEWDITLARTRGADLIIEALSPGDPFRVELEIGGTQVDAIKSQLSALVNDANRLPDQEVSHLCDLVRDHGKTELCTDRDLGAAAQNVFISKSRIMARHLEGRQKQFKAIQLFVYGHTHQYELPWGVEIEAGIVVVANTGAFQRLVTDEEFRKSLGTMSPQEGLRRIALEQLAPCYTAVLVPPIPLGGSPRPQVLAWHMPENGTGELLSPTERKCTRVSTN